MSNKKKLYFILIACIIIILIIFYLINNCKEIDNRTLDKKNDILRLQDIINKASDYDTILIPSGIFYESIIINKPINLIGSNTNNTIIDGGGSPRIIEIYADNVEISNFSIKNSGGFKDNAAIFINSKNNKIKNCEIFDSKIGIYLNNAKTNIINNCKFISCGEGVLCFESRDNNINNCQFYHNSFGLNIKNSKYIKINNSYIYNNGIGIYLKNSEFIRLDNSAVCENNQDGGGIWSFGCKKIEINNCNINHNGVGLKLKKSEAEILFCNFLENMYNTILLEESKNVIVKNCEIIDSMRTAIYVKESQCKFYFNNIIGSYLNGLDCDIYSFCDMRNNWWGSRLGPSLFNFSSREKISLRFKNLFYPWQKKSINNIGTNWFTENRFRKSEYLYQYRNNIFFKERDTDLDGVPDWWEEKWSYDPKQWDDHKNLDPDNDGLNNIEECFTDKFNSNPFHKDIFLEIDWIYNKNYSNKLTNEYIKEAIKIFEYYNINLHIDVGNLGGGEELLIQETPTCTDVRDIYWEHFLENDLNNPRKGIFRYCLIMNDNEEMWGGFVFVGWDNLDTIGICIDRIQDNNKILNREKLIIGGIFHELGHIFGILIDDYGGIDNIAASKYLNFQRWSYKNYMSCLNYRYVYNILNYSDGSHGNGDFNDWEKFDFYFFKNSDFS